MSTKAQADNAAIIAKVAASKAVHAVLQEVPHLIQASMAEVSREKKPPPPVNPRRSRSEPLPIIEVKDYPPISQSTHWRRKRGPRMAFVWLDKEASSEKLFVEQYGDQCSVLRKVSAANALHPRPGVNQCFVQFEVMEGGIGVVIGKLSTKGWKQIPTPKVQLELLPGGTS